MNNNTLLNENQIKAINSYDAPLLILAGAGTGKTWIAMKMAHNFFIDLFMFVSSFIPFPHYSGYAFVSATDSVH